MTANMIGILRCDSMISQKMGQWKRCYPRTALKKIADKRSHLLAAKQYAADITFPRKRYAKIYESTRNMMHDNTTSQFIYPFKRSQMHSSDPSIKKMRSFSLAVQRHSFGNCGNDLESNRLSRWSKRILLFGAGKIIFLFHTIILEPCDAIFRYT